MTGPVAVLGAPHNPAARAAIAERRRLALELRLAGRDLVEIGLRLAADPAVNSAEEATPHGYGASFYERGEPAPEPGQLAKLASNDINRALAERAAGLEAAADQMRAEQATRLDRLISALWADATAGDVKAVAEIRKLEDRRARLFGLDAPTRVNLSGSLNVEDPRQQVAELVELWEHRREVGAGDEAKILELVVGSVAGADLDDGVVDAELVEE